MMRLRVLNSVQDFSVSFDFHLPKKTNSKQVGEMFKCIYVVFTSNLHVEVVRTIVRFMTSELLCSLYLWEFFGQPHGENTFSKNAPVTPPPTHLTK